MATQAHNASLLDLEPDTIIELFELDLGEVDGIYRFHPGKNNLKDIVLSDSNGVLQTYFPLPIETSGYESKGDGSLPRPKIKLANPQGILSDVIKNKNDLVGNLLTRKRIFLKYLNNENFPDDFNPFSEPDPDSRFEDDIFIINKKISENKYIIEFELISPLEFEDVKIPSRRMIANYCPWQYRGEGCLYGQRSDYNNQDVRMANGNSLNPAEFFAKENPNESVRGPNLGIPVADNNNKCFTTKSGYNLSLLWQRQYSNTDHSVEIDNASGYSERTIKINNANGYTTGGGSAIAITVDSFTFSINHGDRIWFNDRATLMIINGSISANPSGTTSVNAAIYGKKLEDNATGHVPQSIQIQSTTADIQADRTIVFTGGGRFELYKSSLYAGGTSTTQLVGYLEGSLSDEEVGNLKYVPGDVVSFPYDIKNLSKFREATKLQQNDTENFSDRMFVCIKDVLPSLDPRYQLDSWAMDDCSKNVRGCKYRYHEFGEYSRGLPFGGFPTIERYKFRG
tara:strand:+ start:3081 stop:4613 length:1533 start_codon:yes stop_codon:yes gene_type:complete